MEAEKSRKGVHGRDELPILPEVAKLYAAFPRRGPYATAAFNSKGIEGQKKTGHELHEAPDGLGDRNTKYNKKSKQQKA